MKGCVDMSTVNPISTPQVPAPAFKGANKKLLNNFFKTSKKLSPEQAVMERLNGMTAAYKIRDKEELKNVVMREAIGGNKDFLAGLNDALANGAAKDIYKKK